MTVSSRETYRWENDGVSSWLGSSEMAERIRSFDWSPTSLGPIADWSSSLRSAVSVCLHSRFPMAIYWGPELNCIYNDAERDLLGKRHPGGLGMPAEDLLRESWEVVGPQLRAVIRYGEATWAHDQPLNVDRRGTLETGYFTYSYSPILDDDGDIGGVLLVTQETTARILAEQRMEVLREIAIGSMDATSPREACVLAVQSMPWRAELEFVLVYLAEHGRALCVARAGRTGRPRPAYLSVDLNASDPLATAFQEVAAGSHESRSLDGHLIVADEAGNSPVRSQAVVVRVARGSADCVDGFVVAGIRDGVPADRASRHFIEMIGIAIGRGVAAARARQEASERARSLEALERAKTTLFSNASHQLRTPLTLILGPLSEVVEDMDLSDSAREQIVLARRNASWMLKIVNGLLDFSRIEAGERIGVLELTDLAQLTREVAAMFRSTVESAGLRLEVDCPPLSQPVALDRAAWEQVVSNLLSNAMKFTVAGSVHVQVRGEAEHALLTVRDTGIGIAPADLSRIFSRFYRVQDPRARSHEGTGLGLALVRQLVRMHGGSISVQSTPGEGTSFLVRLPYRPPHALGDGAPGNGSSPGAGATADAFVEEARGWSDETSFDAVASLEGPSGDGAALIVEDNHDMRDYLCRSLAPRYAVRLAMNGADAYRRAIEDPPSVVISDVMMPGSGGFRLLEDLRADHRTKNIPVILLSARADPESTVEALQRGADDYLVKPFGSRELLARTRAVVEGSRRRSRDAEARGRAAERARAEGQLRSLLNDLKAAQRRIAAAGDVERRRIEHNLHDGAQQRLMAIRLELGLLSGRLELDPGSAAGELDRLRGELDAALEELRELAHGLYPSVLASDGLSAALAAAARHAAIPTELEAPDFPRLPRAIENTVYFCCLEALQNAAKYAGEEAHASIRLGVRHGAVEFEVSDDGVGFDRRAVASGYGLTNLTDRLGALGGEATITSAPGEGTTVAGQIPLVWDVPA